MAQMRLSSTDLIPIGLNQCFLRERSFPLFSRLTGGILQDMENDAQKLKGRASLRENLGKLLVDLGKLIFGAMFLGGILQGELPQAIIMTSGFIAAVFTCAVGLRWMSKTKGG